jgi:hypothetical protein
VLFASFGQSPAAADDVAAKTVVAGLHRPCGIAARLGRTAVRYEMYIAESGAGRVVRWSNMSPNGFEDAITGFPTAGTRQPVLPRAPGTDQLPRVPGRGSAANPYEQTGPQGLLFVDPDLLVVAVAASSDRGQGLLRVFELPEEGETLTADEAIDRPSGPAPLDPSAGQIACYSLTRSRANEFVPDMIVAAIRGAGRQGGLYKSRVQAGVVGRQRPFWADNRSGRVSPPMAVATSNSGRIVTVHLGPPDGGARCRLTFLNPIDGSVELEMPLDLAEVVALAYSPTSGRLYAADFVGGVHRIDDASEPGRPACRVVKIADIARPTALAFAPDGALYVTTFGDIDDNGTLVVLTGNL